MERILQVTYSMDRGGAETYIMNQMRRLDTTKVQYDFFENVYDGDTSDNAYDEEIRERGGRIFKGPQYTKHPLAYARFFETLLKEHPEWRVVHGQFMKAAAPVYLGIAKRNGRYAIAHSHNTKDGSAAKNVAMTAIRYPVRKIADHFFGCSQEAGEYAFGKMIASSSKFEVATNGIDLSLYLPNEERRRRMRHELGFDDGAFVVGHVGRFHPQKNHELLVRAFAVIRRRRPAAKLVLIGMGPLEGAVRQQVRDLGLDDSVIFVGSVNNVPDYLRAMDVFLFPSIYEGLGMVLVEAQAAGLPVVMSREIALRGMNFICEGNVALRSLSESAEAWAEAVLAVRAQTPQDECIELVSHAGYDVEQTTERMSDFYLRAAASLGQRNNP